jgi:type II secretory pathway pseudopilin PulG
MSNQFCAGCGGAVQPSWQYCSACGRPTGTAVLQPAPSRAPWIIILVVMLAMLIPVSGIIAAIAIPNLLTAMQRSKQKRTMADIRTLATATEAYAVDHNTYPPAGSTMDDLEKLLSPTYIRTLPKLDGWENTYRYHCLEPDGPRCLGYAFQSAGKDGELDELPREIVPEATRHFDCDILYANGSFVWYPEGPPGGQ